MTLNKATLSDQIYEILRADILSRKIAPGAKLTLKNLKEQFEVSSTPIREALTRLTDDGLVRYYSNIGVNVIELSREDLEELYQFMGDLDRLAILYSAAHPDQEAICRELEEAVTYTSNLGSATDTPQCSDAKEANTQTWIYYSDRFHLIFYDYCGNSRLKSAAEKLRSQLTIFSTIYETEPEAQSHIAEQHMQIFEAYRSGDFALAGERMKEHLNDSMRYAIAHT
ncbi:MAG: GntR family transcriptional regulator [Lachnospiraceae bacterium]|nr:GntR family transcriptional regulator [Lachnospiraceae bacterium]